jgi:hypothetical protein
MSSTPFSVNWELPLTTGEDSTSFGLANGTRPQPVKTAANKARRIAGTSLLLALFIFEFPRDDMDLSTVLITVLIHHPS